MEVCRTAAAGDLDLKSTEPTQHFEALVERVVVARKAVVVAEDVGEGVSVRQQACEQLDESQLDVWGEDLFLEGGENDIVEQDVELELQERSESSKHYQNQTASFLSNSGRVLEQ